MRPYITCKIKGFLRVDGPGHGSGKAVPMFPHKLEITSYKRVALN
ncbi:hypothetical protein [Peribacillus saganii]|nr:hypothetical protein [Peribacillus saganii]